MPETMFNAPLIAPPMLPSTLPPLSMFFQAALAPVSASPEKMSLATIPPYLAEPSVKVPSACFNRFTTLSGAMAEPSLAVDRLGSDCCSCCSWTLFHMLRLPPDEHHTGAIVKSRKHALLAVKHVLLRALAATRRRTYVRIGSSPPVLAEAGPRNGRSSPRAMVSGRMKA